MASRGSHRDQDEVVWQTTSLPIGGAGLDLRNDANPGTFTKLLNARFEADRLVRRHGHRGVDIRDAGEYPVTLDGATPVNIPITTVGWVYGHGQRLTRDNPLLAGTTHVPEPGVARGTFRHSEQDVIWTGDRLLVVRDDDQPALGDSSFWGGGPPSKRWGIPCYLPVQTDSTPPDTITGDYVEHCVTETIAVTVAGGATDPTAWVVDRSTGAVIDKTTITAAGSSRDIRVFQSGSWVVCLWRTSSNDLYISRWTGAAWSAASVVHAAVHAFDVCLEAGGFHLVWHENDGGTRKLYAGHYSGYSAQNTPYLFRTQLATTDAPTGPMAAAVDPDGRICAIWQAAAGLKARTYSASLVAGTEAYLSGNTGPWDGGLTVSSRELSTEITGDPKIRWVVFASPGATTTMMWEFLNADSPTRQDTRYNTYVASKAFRVGHEVFCWLRATNSQTLYLVGGTWHPIVSGIADREIAANRVVNDQIRAISQVTADPLNSHTYVWARPYNTGAERLPLTGVFATGLTYARGGNVLIGSMNFLPTLSVARYGQSVYLAGSHVRNWDGSQLGDAGFHDYPKVANGGLATYASGGSLSAGDYRFRVYAVRYNARGERFESAAITTQPATAVLNGRIEVTINTLPVTNHDDVVFEVYRTTAGGTTYYLDGFIANTFSAATVIYNSTISDGNLSVRIGDEHAPGVGAAGTLEEFGPIGCAFLATAGDRLWGAGGQVPPGWAQFSKLKTHGGAGFDAIAGAQQVDAQGGDVTSIVGYGDAVVLFERDRIQAVNANGGPDNYGAGSFGVPHTTIADGAVNHVGTAVTQIGVVFWGADGPRLLSPNLQQVDQICDAIRLLTGGLEPTGVQVNFERQEVVWYTAGGTAVLWNYLQVESKFGQLTSSGRWVEWTGLNVAGCSEGALATTDCRMLYEDENASGDAGVPFEYGGATGLLSPEKLLSGATQLRRVGVSGEYIGEHELRVRVYYNNSPLWHDEWRWQPAEDTGLQSGADLADLNAAQIDALGLRDRSGQYATHHRVSREMCRTFRVEWSDISAFRPTYKLHELSFELGVRGGLGRIPVSTFQ